MRATLQAEVIRDLVQLTLVPLEGTDRVALEIYADECLSENLAPRANARAGAMDRQQVRGTMWGIQDVAERMLGASERSEGLGAVLATTTGKPSVYFTLTPAGVPTANHIGSVEGNLSDDVLPATGGWDVRVHLTRNAAHRGESAAVTLSIGIGRGAQPFAEPRRRRGGWSGLVACRGSGAGRATQCPQRSLPVESRVSCRVRGSYLQVSGETLPERAVARKVAVSPDCVWVAPRG